MDESLLDELARVFARAAVDDFLAMGSSRLEDTKRLESFPENASASAYDRFGAGLLHHHERRTDENHRTGRRRAATKTLDPAEGAQRGR